MIKKNAALSACYNEVSTVAFTIASLLPHVDFYVLVDSGSTDGTLKLVRELFDKDIKSGRLHIIEYGPLDDWDISKPKNAAIAKILEEDYEYFIRLDADDVFLGDEEAKAAVAFTESLKGSQMTHASFNQWELYQYKANTLSEWFNSIDSDLDGYESESDPNFWCLRIPPPPESKSKGSYGHARIYKTDGAVSVGKWVDEANGLPGEDIKSRFGSHGTGWPSELIAHYGWARPMYKKLEKNSIWVGQEKLFLDPRINKLHNEWNNAKHYNIDRLTYGDWYWPKNIIFPWNMHPKAVRENIYKVREILCA